ncbi:hypothetical protein C4K03_0544 [Pseudomonas synxantha]|uniref:Uncharacterized protein n=1 Tax=Pseudomonas synxantha TaxID=47883 RepID=A0A3G7U222_9PSED|nr:hypothetical protein C4K03_0544 [Pseudomonas synxantha]
MGHSFNLKQKIRAATDTAIQRLFVAGPRLANKRRLGEISFRLFMQRIKRGMPC